MRLGSLMRGLGDADRLKDSFGAAFREPGGSFTERLIHILAQPKCSPFGRLATLDVCAARLHGCRRAENRRERFRPAAFELGSSNQVPQSYQTKKGAYGSLFGLARPERFELPTNWFEA